MTHLIFTVPELLFFLLFSFRFPLSSAEKENRLALVVYNHFFFSKHTVPGSGFFRQRSSSLSAHRTNFKLKDLSNIKSDLMIEWRLKKLILCTKVSLGIHDGQVAPRGFRGGGFGGDRCQTTENYVLTVSLQWDMWNAENGCMFNGMKYLGEERENKSRAACVWWANTKGQELLAWQLEERKISSIAQKPETEQWRTFCVFSAKFAIQLRISILTLL